MEPDNDTQNPEKIPLGKPNYSVFFSDVLLPKPLKEISEKQRERSAKNIEVEKERNELDNINKLKKMKKTMRRRVSFDGEQNGEEKEVESGVVGNKEVKNKKLNYDDKDNKNDNNSRQLSLQIKKENEEIEAEEKKKKIKEEKELTEITCKALEREEFSELASDILRNTFYNLLSESLYGEFAIHADAVHFVVKE